MATATFTNPTGIARIPPTGTGATTGAVATQTIVVSGMTGNIADIKITLTDLSHTFPDDLDFLLVAPDGTGFIFMSDAGGITDLVLVDLVFSDGAAAALPDNGATGSGTYLPSNFGGALDPFPGFAGTPISPAPDGAGTFSSAFGGKAPNGTWTLYVSDDLGGDVGSLGSWSIEVTTDDGAAPPIAVADSYATSEDTALTIGAAEGVLANDTDADSDPLTASLVSDVAHGTLLLNADGSFTYTPDADFFGTDSFQYVANDGSSDSPPVTVTIAVAGAPDEAVIGGEDRGAVTEAGRAGPGMPTAGGQLTISDPDRTDRFEPVEAGTPSIRGFGTVEMSHTGAWTYTLDNENPAVDALGAGQTLTDRVVVAAADGTQHTIVITITGADDETPAPRPAWSLLGDDVALVAATYQFFTGAVPQALGFEYLISSPANATDLNDPYYAGFNTENLYINFASNLATAAGGSATLFDAIYGGLSFEATVRLAYRVITGDEPGAAALDFFLDAEGFYQRVAAERVVRPGVDLAEATKIVAIGSILNEAVRSDTGLLGQAVNDFAAELAATGTSNHLGESLFATA